MNNTGILVISVLVISFSALAQEQKPHPVTCTIGHYETVTSRVLEEDRTILVHLPGDYQTALKKYPVLYILDGEDTHRYMQSIMGITYYSGVRRLPQLIVVGILNTDRTRDMTPRKVIQRENSGGGDAFLEFIGSELIPYIDGKYRTVPYRVLSGGSSAGMFTLYTLFSRPESFHAYIASRPALNSHAGYTWDADVISRRAVSFFREIPSGKISLFIDHGGQEDVLHNPEPIHKLSGLFKRDSQESFYWEIQRTGESGYRSAESLINGLLSVFDSWYYPADSLYTRGFSGIRKHAESLSERLAYPVTAADLLTENDLLRFGYRFLENNNIKEAINIFEYAVSVYFNSWNAFDGLAEAYKKAD